MQITRGQVAVVTGGGSGIGRGIATALAREGVDVVVADVSADNARAVAQELTGLGVRARDVVVDVASRESIAALGEVVREWCEAPDLLFNNAGVSIGRRASTATHEDWQWVIGVNLWGVIHGIEEFLPGMIARGKPGRVINTASMNGFVPSNRSGLYSATKFAVVGLSESLHNELAGSSVGVSILAPAWVSTAIFDSEKWRPTELQSAERPAEEWEMGYELGPSITPDEAAALTLQGIRDDRLYIHTDPLVAPVFTARHENILRDVREVFGN